MTDQPKDCAVRWMWPSLAGVIALATVLRFVGLGWGLFNDFHSYSYHPDEFLLIGAAFISIYLNRTFDPRFYNYPTLYIYFAALGIAVGIGYGAVSTDSSVYLAARIVTAITGVGAVAATYWAGSVLFGKTAGLLAALILAIAPLHVQHSHFATVDVPSTLPVALCLGYTGLILKRGSWRDYILSGTMVGLAAGTKYNACLIILAPIAAHFLALGVRSMGRDIETPSPGGEGRGEGASLLTSNLQPPTSKPGEGARRARRTKPIILSPKLWIIPAAAIAAFIISTPGSVLRASSFIHGLTYEMRHASEGHGLVFAGTGNGFVYTFTSSLCYGLGPALAAAFLLAVIWGLWKRDRAVAATLAFTIPYYALISMSQVRFARYSLPLFPAIALLVGWLVTHWYGRLARRNWAIPRLTVVASCTLLVLGTLAYLSLVILPFVRPDPRDAAVSWISRHIPEGDSIGMIDYPWFYSPPLSKDFGFGALDQRRDAAGKSPYNIIVFAESERAGDWWKTGSRPQWIAVSDFESDDAQRLRGRRDLSANAVEQVARVNTDLDLIERHYRPRAKFGFGFVRFGPGLPPHDMRYTTPMITIYELKR